MPEQPPSNGSSHVLKWMLGIFTAVLGAVTALMLVWIVGIAIKNQSDIRLIESRLYGIEHMLDSIGKP